MKLEKVKKGTLRPSKQFQSIESEAEYWDTHSVVDEIDAQTPVGFHRVQKTDSLTIRFAHEDMTKLREEANQQGIGPSTLARMLVKKGLQTL